MSRRGLRLLLVAYLLVVLRITQWPELADPSALRWLERALTWWHERGLPTAVDVPVVEAAANVVMFVPFGVLVPLAARWGPAATVLAGALFSTQIELSQLAFFPSRVATVQDVVMNTAGAVLGVALLRLTSHVARRGASRLGPVTSDSGTTSDGSGSGTDPVARSRSLDLFRESRLAPVEIDLGRVFRIGIALWAIAVVVATVLLLADQVEARTVAICGTGLALGFAALAWERRRQRRTAAAR